VYHERASDQRKRGRGPFLMSGSGPEQRFPAVLPDPSRQPAFIQNPLIAHPGVA
jgi:hypothetical protein